MLRLLPATLLPCPLCERAPARAGGACGPCLDGLAGRSGSAREGDVDVAWLAPYEGRAVRAVRAAKFGGRAALAGTLGGRLGRHLAGLGWRAARVVPVPLHPRRRWARGYDQADRAARGVAAELGLPVVRSLRRVRATARQARAGGARRDANVRGAFRSRRCPPVPVVLVDDVWTTGATARACRDALRNAGAREVRVAVIARAGATAPQSQSSAAVAPPRSAPTRTWG